MSETEPKKIKIKKKRPKREQVDQLTEEQAPLNQANEIDESPIRMKSPERSNTDSLVIVQDQKNEAKNNSQLFTIQEEAPIKRIEQPAAQSQIPINYLQQIEQLQMQLQMLKAQQQQSNIGMKQARVMPADPNKSLLMDGRTYNGTSPMHQQQYNERLMLMDDNMIYDQDTGELVQLKSTKPTWTSRLAQNIQKGFEKVVALPVRTADTFLNPEKANKKMHQRMSMKSNQQLDEQYRQEHCILYYAQMAYIGFKHVAMPLVTLFSSVLCLANLVLWSYYDIGYLGQNTHAYLTNADQLMAVLFMIEILFNLIESGSIVELFDFDNLSLVLIIFEIYWVQQGNQETTIIQIIHFFRSLRITKLRYLSKLLTHYVKKYILQLKTDDLTMEDVVEHDEEGEMNQFIFESLVKFGGGITIESSAILMIDKMCDYNGFFPFNGQAQTQQMDYLSSAYFVIVSFSTIGFGDIYPVTSLSRISTCIMCILNITVMSNFLGHFIEHLFALSPYYKDYDFKDHVVVIGDISNEKIKDFMEELIENDLVERDMNNPMGQLSTGIKCIIVSEFEPNTALRMQALFYADKHDNEIVFLKDNFHSQSKKWYKKCNLREAKIVFCFSKECETDVDAFEQDKLMSFTAKNVKETFPSLRVMLVLNSVFKQLIEKDSLFADIETISPREMNEFILATSIENPGLGTTLQHLLTMKSKQLSKDVLQAAQTDQFLFSYIRNMQSEIYQVQMPDFFVGMSFRKCAQVLYLHGIKLDSDMIEPENFMQSEDPTMMLSLIAIETVIEDSFITMDEHTHTHQHNETDRNLLNSKIQTFGDWIRGRDTAKTPSTQSGKIPEMKDDDENTHQPIINSNNISQSPKKEDQQFFRDEKQHTLEKVISHNSHQTSQENETTSKIKKPESSVKKSQILINPQNYTIRKNDIAYCICDNHAVAMNTRQINSVDSEMYKNFLTNYDLIRKNIGNRRTRQKAIDEMFESLDGRHEMKKGTTQSEKTGANDTSRGSLNMSPRKAKNLVKLKFQVYDLRENQFPEDKLKNHIIIVGKIQKFSNFIYLLRKYSSRPIVLFTQDEMEQDKWTEIRRQMDVDTENIYIFKGNFLNLIHIDQLGILDSYQILLTTQLFGETFPDAIGLCFARILQDYYDQNNFLIELLDDEKLQFLSHNIKLKHVKGVPAFLYQTFMQGNVHFSSMISGMLGRVVYNPSWLRLFQDLAVPKKHEKRILNQTMNCIRISGDAALLFKFFGFLQFALFEMKPSLIAISLVKFKIGSRYQEYKMEHFQASSKNFDELKKKYFELDGLKTKDGVQQDQQEQDNKFNEYFISTLGKFVGHKFVLTNPAFYTPIEENDYVIVIGDLMKDSNLFDKNNSEQKLETEEMPDEEYEEIEQEIQRYKNYKQRMNFKELLKKQLLTRIETYKEIERDYKGLHLIR